MVEFLQLLLGRVLEVRTLLHPLAAVCSQQHLDFALRSDSGGSGGAAPTKSAADALTQMVVLKCN